MNWKLALVAAALSTCGTFAAVLFQSQPLFWICMAANAIATMALFGYGLLALNEYLRQARRRSRT
jgi:hypothetical protein